MSDINLLPLLHVSIARKFLVSHQNFTRACDGNYFNHVAEEVSKLLLCHKDDLPELWIT